MVLPVRGNDLQNWEITLAHLPLSRALSAHAEVRPGIFHMPSDRGPPAVI
jgi:hypothetical protein